MFDLLNEAVEIRLAKAQNPKTERTDLDLLSKDKFWFVRDLVASNTNTAVTTLESLLHDVDFRVRNEAKRNLESRGINLLISSAERRKSSNIAIENIQPYQKEK